MDTSIEGNRGKPFRVVVEEGKVDDGRRLVDVEMAVTRQTGGTHLKGWATFVVPD